MLDDRAGGTSLPEGEATADETAAPEVGGREARLTLAVLTGVYVFNFIDRQILSILAEPIRADLGLSDAQIGFLYGTAFAVFYAIFGIPLGRLADVWVRTRLIGIGLAFWSVMTALSGMARGFGSLAAFRIGVGVGEASASPAAYSLLSDYFPPRLRATAISIYASGIYIGAGIGLFLGGAIVDGWAAAFPAGTAPLGLAGWQVAFLAVGFPGLLMALVVRRLREPVRGMSEGLPPPPVHPHPFHVFAEELASVIPPFSWWSLIRSGASPAAIGANLMGAAGLAGLAMLLVSKLGHPEQWGALGIGFYCAGTWAQGLARRDPPAFAMVFRSPALLFACFGFACISFVSYGVGFWSAPLLMRLHGVSATEVGLALGMGSAIGSASGVMLGGWLSDRWKRRTPNARLLVGIGLMFFAAPSALGFVYAETAYAAYGFSVLWSFFSSMWVGNAPTTVNDLVIPRMRAASSAVYLLIITFIGLALGPFAIGQVSDLLASQGQDAASALQRAMITSLGMFPVAALLLLLAARTLPREEATRVERARRAGEPE